ncbi:MAG: pyruvate dehydrogenase complex E1 component subunit beta [Candidatus Manganitrophaceae bacterium]|nr:MAG: pyruvate dehydrogenase complex E1 component subunit beta [Candidatus Manganitrophaceae bacterium]
MAHIAYREALGQAMSEEMRRDEKVFLMGEEVGFYQGAFKVSRGMLEEFGPMRVIDTPITEAGFTGVGIGAAMVGLRPIIEMMTFNFSILAMDQIINNAAKVRSMSGGQFTVPMVVRGPGGSAARLAAQHSQSLESLYCHIAGLKVIAPSVPKDAKGLLKSAIRDNNPVICFEAQALYGTMGEVPEGEYTIPIGVADVKREGKDVTLIAWSKMLLLCLRTAEELAKQGIDAEVVDPRTLRPLDMETILQSVRKTNRVVIVEEAWPYASVGAEIADRITHEALDILDAPVERVTGVDAPIPYAKNLEQAALPSPEKIIQAVKKVMYLE